MANRPPFAEDEWYHCYNRGVDKRVIFDTAGDYHRFIHLLYLCNSKRVIHRSDLSHFKTGDILQVNRGEPLVDLGCFALMPNHFHLLLHERTQGGISTFMQKLATAYTMHYNVKNNRDGSLFSGTFKSRHITTDEYLQHAIAYVHCNPIGTFDKEWKHGVIQDVQRLERKLRDYAYSSLAAFGDKKRPFRAILSDQVFKVYRAQPIRAMIKNAAKYDEDNDVKV